MSQDDADLRELASALAEGAEIDWASVESSAADESLRLTIHELQVIASIARVHCSSPLADPQTADSLADPFPEALGTWGTLRLLEQVGKGAFGDVYRAWDTRLDREVALKLLPASLAGGDARATSIIHEGRLLARVRHANVVTIYGAERTEDRVGLWMEFVKGRTLGQILSEGRVFDPTEVIDIGVELCHAISAVHDAGLFHRDIKAQNVMLAEDGRIVLMDFGSGREFVDKSSMRLAGTPLYLAPELLDGKEATIESDIYSLGVLLYHLLTGSYPVRARALSDLRRAHERGERASLRTVRPDLSPKIARIIERAIDPQPERRYASSNALAADLAALKARRRLVPWVWPVLSSFRSRLRKLARLHPRAAAAVLVLMLVLVPGIAWIWTSALDVTFTVTKPVGGTVIGSGLVCGTHGTTCSTQRTAGDVVELYIVADPGYVFAGFVGDCLAVLDVDVGNLQPAGRAPAGQILMNKAKSCGATFTQVGPAPARATSAERLFYEMKAQDVIIARLEADVERTGSTVSPENLRTLQDRRRELERFYEQAVTTASDRGLNERERLILRVTRLLGECDVTAPADYLHEVDRYIEQWRSTPRFEQAVKRAQQNGYAKSIAATFMARQLPPQFFYLAMRESGFMPTLSGPQTRWGIAKGMWQFTPETAQRYGLNVGPYFQDARVDMADDRLNWEKATVAAASYIKEIYATDAQASSLLVMASYNWGERRIVNRLRRMPLNPRERNFWTLLAQHRDDVPRQAYDYVFWILSAAVIGENPRLFGFEFDNPLTVPTSH
jgi:hypothetical protein